MSVSPVTVGAIDTGKSLQQAVILDYASHVQLLQARSIESRQQHVEYHQQIYLTILILVG